MEEFEVMKLFGDEQNTMFSSPSLLTVSLVSLAAFVRLHFRAVARTTVHFNEEVATVGGSDQVR